MSDTDKPDASQSANINNSSGSATAGAFAAGLALVVLPSAALILGIHPLEDHSMVGLPILAIFGIMILFGALALISTVFARLGLSAQSEALALPPGSIRAAIALALIVLFALISVMLYQSLSRPYVIEHQTYAAKEAFVKEPSNRILAVQPEPCPAALQPCTPEQRLYTIHLRQSPTPEAADLAKQLLILVGTLMTSVTSFYFASRSTEAVAKSVFGAQAAVAAATTAAAPPPAVAPTPPPDATLLAGSHLDHEDSCDIPITNPTADVDLPAAKGGVAS
jgi:hypothetical protein